MNDYSDNRAIEIAQQLFIATEGTSYRGRSYVARTALEPTGFDEAAPVRGPYDSGVWTFTQDSLGFTRADGRATSATYTYFATVDFNRRTFDQSIRNIVIPEIASLSTINAANDVQAAQSTLPQNLSINDVVRTAAVGMPIGGTGYYAELASDVTLLVDASNRPGPQLHENVTILQGSTPVLRGETYIGGTRQ